MDGEITTLRLLLLKQLTKAPRKILFISGVNMADHDFSLVCFR